MIMHLYENHIFGYPILGRHGLGNMLLPWARCYLWCKDNNVPMIAPIWTQLRIGPYLRRDRDKRNYNRLFHHRGYISGIRRIFYLLTLRRVPEERRDEVVQRSAEFNRSIVVLRGMGDYFESIKSRHTELMAELRRITKPAFADTGLSHKKFVGIHVRRADFSIPSDTSVLRQGQQNYQIPLDWYISALKSIRACLGWEAEALVFSDGSPNELKELLSLPNVALYSGGSAITHMLALSEARVMVASGSTFSMWASFLGQVPCIWYPGQRRQCVIGLGNDADLEPEWERGEALPANFLAVVRQRWGHTF